MGSRYLFITLTAGWKSIASRRLPGIERYTGLRIRGVGGTARVLSWCGGRTADRFGCAFALETSKWFRRTKQMNCPDHACKIRISGWSRSDLLFAVGVLFLVGVSVARIFSTYTTFTQT